MKEEGRTRIIKLKSQISALHLEGASRMCLWFKGSQVAGKEAYFKRSQVLYSGLMRGVPFNPHPCS